MICISISYGYKSKKYKIQNYTYIYGWHPNRVWIYEWYASPSKENLSDR